MWKLELYKTWGRTKDRGRVGQHSISTSGQTFFRATYSVPLLVPKFYDTSITTVRDAIEALRAVPNCSALPLRYYTFSNKLRANEVVIDYLTRCLLTEARALDSELPSTEKSWWVVTTPQALLPLKEYQLPVSTGTQLFLHHPDMDYVNQRFGGPYGQGGVEVTGLIRLLTQSPDRQWINQKFSDRYAIFNKKQKAQILKGLLNSFYPAIEWRVDYTSVYELEISGQEPKGELNLKPHRGSALAPRFRLTGPDVATLGERSSLAAAKDIEDELIYARGGSLLGLGEPSEWRAHPDLETLTTSLEVPYYIWQLLNIRLESRRRQYEFPTARDRMRYESGRGRGRPREDRLRYQWAGDEHEIRIGMPGALIAGDMALPDYTPLGRLVSQEVMAGIALTGAEIIVLMVTAGLKSSYRKEAYERWTLHPNTVKKAKAQLAQKKLLTKRGGITAQGRSARNELLKGRVAGSSSEVPYTIESILIGTGDKAYRKSRIIPFGWMLPYRSFGEQHPLLEKAYKERTEAMANEKFARWIYRPARTQGGGIEPTNRRDPETPEMVEWSKDLLSEPDQRKQTWLENRFKPIESTMFGQRPAPTDETTLLAYTSTATPAVTPTQIQNAVEAAQLRTQILELRHSMEHTTLSGSVLEAIDDLESRLGQIGEEDGEPKS